MKKHIIKKYKEIKNMDKKIKIYIATHKKYKFPINEEIYKPIFVGREEKNYLSDTTGDNISNKNKNFCELTALYWLWKNDLKEDYLGLVHYRRYFNFKEKPKKHISSNELEYDNVKNIIKENLETKKYDIILPKKKKIYKAIDDHYKICHIEEDWNKLIEIILKKYPNYQDVIKKTLKNEELYAFNMFITSKDRFKNYMEWLFDILFEVEKNIVISDNNYQARVFGFMSERLFNLYIEANKLKVLEIPYTMLHDSKIDALKHYYFDWKGEVKNKIKKKFKK